MDGHRFQKMGPCGRAELKNSRCACLQLSTTPTNFNWNFAFRQMPTNCTRLVLLLYTWAQLCFQTCLPAPDAVEPRRQLLLKLRGLLRSGATQAADFYPAALLAGQPADSH